MLKGAREVKLSEPPFILIGLLLKFRIIPSCQALTDLQTEILSDRYTTSMTHNLTDRKNKTNVLLL